MSRGIEEFRNVVTRRFSTLLGLIVMALMVGVPATWGQDLGGGQLQVAGLRLTVSPEAQTVPFDTPTIVETAIEGLDPGAAPPLGLRALADFTGPEIDGVLTLETVPGQPFRIPRLRLDGEYQLDNIRLAGGDSLLAYAEPRSATVRVTQVLVTRVSSRALTLDEIRGYGIIIGDDSFQALNFTFGFGVDGDEVSFDVPIVVDFATGIATVIDAQRNRDWLPPTPRFRPPPIVPFTFEIARPTTADIPTGGCPPQAIALCLGEFASPPLVGVLAFPTDVGLLHQFFSVVMMVQNGAPEGDVLTVRDLTARIQLPPGLRQAETDPPTPLGVPVPVRVPGPDGELGTGDDLTFLIAQATGEAGFLVEGLREGTHVVDFALDGVLEGLPTGPQRIKGSSRGAVVVRDPHLQVTINHPDVVRDGEPYPLRLTVSNIGPAPVNLVSLTLPVSGVSGADVVGSRTRTIPTLVPGDGTTVTFDLIARRTGRVVASTVKSGSSIAPQFEFSVGVSNDIPLSPDALILPKSTEALPASIVEPAISLLGLGHSLATASESDLALHLPRVTQDQVSARVYRLAQAGRHRALGEPLFETAAVLAAELLGARDGFLPWDVLRRSSTHGDALASAFGAIFDNEAQSTSTEALFDRLASTTGFLPARHLVLVDGPGAAVVLTGGQGGRLAGAGAGAERTLPLAELYPLAGATLATIESPREAGYRLAVRGTGNVDVHLLVPAADGGLRVARWRNVALTGDDVATVDFALGAAVPDLLVDRFEDGAIDQSLTPTLETLDAAPFEAIVAVQNVDVDPSGHVVDVLFSRDVDPASLDPRDASHFVLPGRVSNGGFVQRGLYGTDQNPDITIAAMTNFRMVRVVFDNPLDPLATHMLTIDDVSSPDGAVVGPVSVPVTINASTVGAPVEGVVIGPDGAPVAFAEVRLNEYDESFLAGCVSHRTAVVRADADGRYRFDFVRGETCDQRNRFRIEALDPVAPWRGDVTGRVRTSGEPVTLNVVMLGRGRIEGTVRFDDGTVPDGVQVLAYNDVFQDGRRATVTPDGRYYVSDVVVGAVSLSAHDADGNFVFATVELPLAGAIVQQDLIVPRASPVPTGHVRGTVVEVDGGVPVADAFVALYVDARLIGARLSETDGRFDFGVVPAGVVEIEAFHPETHETGGQLFFEVAPDEVRDVTVVLRDDRGAIEGHVYRQALDGTLTPIPNAVVWVHLQGANTVSDGTGAYRLDGVLAGTVQVRGADPVTGLGLAGSVTVTEGGVATRDLILVESGPVGGITGQVLDYDGQPVVGAVIHIGNGHPNPINWHHRAETDTQGQFVLADIGPGTHPVHAVSGSHGGIALATVRFPGDTPNVTVRFKRGEIRLRTLVRDLDGALVGVTSQVQMRKTIVRHELVGTAGFPTGHETDANGLITFPNTLVGGYEIFVSNPFHGEQRIRGVLVEHGDVVEHEVIFEPAGAVRGIVRDHDGVTPTAGATVGLHHSQLGDFDVTSDANGVFAFELVPPGCFSVRATIDGLIYRTASISGCLSRPGEILEGVEVVLPRQGSVTGRVDDSNGVPVPGAVVSLREYVFPRRMLEANADTEGRFAFDNVFAGEIGLRAQAPALGGLGGRASTAITVEGEAVDVVIALEGTGELIGQVLSPIDAAPVAFAEVSLRNSFGFVDALNADEDGQYRFRLLPFGPYEVRAFEAASGRFGRNADPVISTNGEVVVADVVLQARGEVDGHVTEPELGGPVPAATVKLTSITPFFTLETYSSSDATGYFLFGGIPEGPFRLTTQEPGSRRRASGEGEIVTEDERVTVDLTFARYGTVSGAVLNPPGIDPGLFPNVNTRAIKRSGGSLVIGATLDNPYVFDGLLPNESFEIRAEEIGGPHRGIAQGRLNAEGDDMTLDVTMIPLGAVRVSVVDSFGTPVSGVEVNVAVHRPWGGEFRDGGTGTDHEVLFTEVPAGVVSTSVYHPPTGLRGSATASLTLEGETVVLNVALQDTGFVRGRVLLADGVTPAVESLAALRQGSRWLYSSIAPDGAFSFEAVRLGDYELVLQESFGDGQYLALGSIDVNGEIDDFGDLVLDEHDPTLLSITPASGTRDVALDVAPVLVFDEPMDTSRFQTNISALVRVVGAFGSHLTQPSWSADGTTLTLTPTTPLASGTVYELVVSDAVYDLAGRRLPHATRVTFYTADVIPPAVIETVPANDAVEVPIDSSVLITFSEPVDLFSLSGPALQLDDLTTGTGVSTTFQLRPGEREVIVTPVGGLIADHQYRVTVQGVEDTAGNVQASPTVFTFWAPDETPPTVAWTSPVDGAAFIAGESMTLTAQAADNREMARVEFHIDGGFVVDDVAPYEVTVPAPVVAASGVVTLTATAVDRFGNTASDDRDITVSPRVNGSAPGITTPCLYDGDRVLPGVLLPVPVVVTDDEAVERFIFFVDDALIEEVRFGAATSVSHEFAWMPPIDAAPGTTFTLRVDARDYAGNVATHTVTVIVPAESVLTGDQILDASWNGQIVTLSNGVFTVDGPLAVNELSLLPGTTLRPVDGTTLDVAATTTIRVQCGATIDATGQGFAGGTSGDPLGQAPPWASSSAPDAGGSHGGLGLVWDGAGPAGDVYDSVYRPRLAGGGGALGNAGASGPGNAGGGAIRLVADSVVVAGDVLARGGEGASSAAAAGGGGAIWIDALTLRGGGIVDASGGDKGHCSAGSGSPEGAGGGGRVALWADVVDGFDAATQARATGGTLEDCFGNVNGYGGAGTVFVRSASMAHGELHVDNGVLDPVARPVVATPLPELGTNSVTAVSIVGGDAWITGPSPFRPRWDGAWMTLLDTNGARLGTFPVLSIDGAGRVLLLDAATVAGGAVSYQGEYRFDRLRFGDDVGLELTSPLGGSLVTLDGGGQLSGTIATDNALVSAGATLKPLAGLPLRFDIADSLTIESGAMIDASGQGYAGGVLGAPSGDVPPWVVAPGVNAGGSHGGQGILWDHAWNDPPGPPGDVFDSVYWPTLPGGGGARRSTGAVVQDGRAGGGVLILEAGHLVLDGMLAARGESDDVALAAAGAGGSIAIRTDVLDGSGSIDVSGGDVDKAFCPSFSQASVAGAGGGGRVALWVSTTLSFDTANQVVAHGGATRCVGSDQDHASPGTVYLLGPDSVDGTIFIANGGDDRAAGATPLPVLGTGMIAAWVDEAADAWLTASTTLHPRWTGAWMALFDGAGTPLGEYRVAAIDDTGRARLSGASGLTGASSFAGRYRFDAVVTGHGGGLHAEDEVAVETMVLEGQSELGGIEDGLVLSNLTLRAGAFLHLTDTRPLLDISGTLTIEAGAILDATGTGYPGGSYPVLEGGAPASVTPASGRTGGGHGGISNYTTAGEVYDSVYHPSRAGGGGGAANGEGLSGGGVLTIRANDVVLDGEIRARGASQDITFNGPSLNGAGAGGTIVLDAQRLLGQGLINASGGVYGTTSNNNGGKGGGGGRVALRVDDLASFDIASQVRVDGGSRATPNGITTGFASPGTIFAYDQNATHGELWIHQHVRDAEPLPDTPLPAAGRGTLATVTPDSLDPNNVWVTADAADPLFGLGLEGMVLRVAGVDHPIISQSPDRMQLLLADAAGQVAVGDDYVGVYRFDAVHLDGGVTLVLGDADDVGLYDVGDGTVVRLIETNAPVIESVTPAAGTVVLQGWTIAASAVVTDNDAVADVTFEWDGQVIVDALSPYQADFIAPQVSTATDFDLVVTARDQQGNVASVTHALRVEPGDPPVITSLEPAAGTVYSAGQPLSVVATVTDDDVVAQVSLTFDGQTLVDNVAPWAWSVTAPAVSSPTMVTLAVEATDAQGHQATFSHTIQITPQSTAEPPVLVVDPCPADGDLVAPGSALSFAFAAADANGITSWSLSIDGGAIDGSSGLVGVNEIAQSVPWVVPLAAQPGQTFAVQITAVSTTGGAATETLMLTVPANGFLTGAQDLGSAQQGQDLLLGPGVFTVVAPLDLAAVRLMAGATLRGNGPLALTVTGRAVVSCGATIDLDGAGFAGGVSNGHSGKAPVGVSASGVNAGGSHGGGGSKGYRSGTAGEVFGSVYAPTFGGGGGGAYYGSGSGGDGGGALHLVADEVVIDGAVRARGETRDYAIDVNQNLDAGGAGGGIYIQARVLRGVGQIDAAGGSFVSGGNSQTLWAGGGGGGRVALVADEVLGFDPTTQVSVLGGVARTVDDTVLNRAAAGTVLVVDPAATFGTLYLGSAELADAQPPAVATMLPSLGGRTVTMWTDDGVDAWVTSSIAFQARWLGTWATVRDAAGTTLGSFAVTAIDSTGAIRLDGAAGVSSAATVTGGYRFDGIAMAGGVRLDATDPVAAGDLLIAADGTLPAVVEASSFTVAAGAVLGASQGSLDLSVSGVVTVEAGAAIDLDGTGFAGGVSNGHPGKAPIGVSASGSNAGGSHGGAGAKGGRPGLAGEVYDSVYWPSLGGGGGGAYFGGDAGGAGGGVLRIDAAEVVLDGTIRARGESRDGTATPPHYYDGGGAGGTVLIAAPVVRGTGTIDVSGGSYTPHANLANAAGGGGGGRVALWAAQALGFDAEAQVVAHGGTSVWQGTALRPPAAPGTILVAGPGAAFGHLIVDGGGAAADSTATVLPALGVGTVASFTSVGADAWLSAGSGALPIRWQGASVALFDALGGALGVFDVVVANDGQLLVAGAGALTGVAAYEGRYRFDAVTVREGARLDATDPIDHGAVVVEGAVALPAEIVATSLTVRAGAVLSGFASSLTIDVAGTATIEAGATINLDGSGYLGGASNGASGKAPLGISASGSNAGGSHGGAGAKGGRPGLAGEVYDSVYLPVRGGGGGGAYFGSDTGGAGGGVLSITAAEVVLDGAIQARGESRDGTASPPQYYDGSGGGGTVLIAAPILRGAGTIDVSGGDYTPHANLANASGGGGGGRVALWVEQSQAFDVATQVMAHGGTSLWQGAPLRPNAAPGTVFVAGPSAIDGDLHVDAGTAGQTGPIPDTHLPAIGSGTVGVVDVSTDDPADAWIEPADGATLFDVGATGMWVRIGGTDYRVLDEWVDRRRLLLAGAAATVVVTDAYEGVYRFDEVIARHGATVVIPDLAVVGTIDADPDSGVQTQALMLMPEDVDETGPPQDWLPPWMRSPTRLCRGPEAIAPIAPSRMASRLASQLARRGDEHLHGDRSRERAKTVAVGQAGLR